MTRSLRSILAFPGLPDLALLLLLIGVVWVGRGIADDPGVGWHLRTGQWISETEQIPFRDPFLATSGTRSWIATQWLADLLFFRLFAAGDWALLHLFIAVVALIPVMILSALMRREGLFGPAPFLALLLTGVLCSLQWIARPVVLSFMLFGVLYMLLMRVERVQKVSLLTAAEIVLLFPVWANLHSGFPMGLMLVGCFALSLAFQQKWKEAGVLAGVGAVGLAATLINPYELQLLRNIFQLVGDDFFMRLNQEWYSPNFLDPSRFPLFLAAVLVCWGLSPRTSLGQRFALCLFFFFALMSVRYLPFFALVAALPIAHSLSRKRILSRFSDLRGSSWGYTAIFAVILFGFVVVKGAIPALAASRSMPGSSYPYGALSTLQNDSKPGAVFLSPDWGGFVTFHLYPRRAAFIDDRNELNGRELYEKYFQIVQARGDWKLLLANYEVRWALLMPGDILVEALRRESQWEEIQNDVSFVLFRRRDL